MPYCDLEKVSHVPRLHCVRTKRLFRRSCGLLVIWDDTRSNSVPAAPELSEVIHKREQLDRTRQLCDLLYMGTKVSNSSSATCNFNHRCRQWSTDPEWLETGLSANWHQSHRLIFYSVRGLSNSCKALFDINWYTQSCREREVLWKKIQLIPRHSQDSNPLIAVDKSLHRELKRFCFKINWYSNNWLYLEPVQCTQG